MNVSTIKYITVVTILIFLLASVRFFQDHVFYDPLDQYFHSDYQSTPIPQLDIAKLLLSNALRYLINSGLGIAVLWILFKSRSYLNASLWVYLFAFVILNVLFFIALQFDTDLSKMALFYIRRFMIHPLLLFVLVAGGYYLKNTCKISIEDSSEHDGKR